MLRQHHAVGAVRESDAFTLYFVPVGGTLRNRRWRLKAPPTTSRRTAPAAPSEGEIMRSVVNVLGGSVVVILRQGWTDLVRPQADEKGPCR
jgi:hypothetical protein